MKLRGCLSIALILPCLVFAAPASEEDRMEAMQALKWQEGPSLATIADKAVLKTTADLLFIDEQNSKRFLELTGNIPEDGNYIIYNRKDGWWAVFQFDPSGYVKDDEKIDADALLKNLKENDAPSNKERQRLGIAEIYTDGWSVPPHYDEVSKRLEWGVRLRSNNHVSVNYTVRILGRSGVTSATLVSSPDKLASNVESFKSVLPGFEYKSGEKYSEFKQGDRIAEYGLAALVAGGAAAVATKKGLWGVLGAFLAATWKVLAGAGVAVFAGVRSLFRRKPS
ncbi:DUF2167 domain-containing protein [Propionivibrio soli]|jgi:uncharacterized membrane-anchored protein|uniref:DUF2167 domain-containing protein n=1 Tax=Propionivibrio soli TaxID=2976531 RepID=UPI0021E991EF|nr:DUF2167 domain-containing protein [Propionivibrio soli]